MPVDPPTEQEKLDGNTNHTCMGTIVYGGVEKECEIEVATTPNDNNGYDVVVTLPACPISAVENQ